MTTPERVLAGGKGPVFVSNTSRSQEAAASSLSELMFQSPDAEYKFQMGGIMDFALRMTKHISKTCELP